MFHESVEGVPERTRVAENSIEAAAGRLTIQVSPLAFMCMVKGQDNTQEPPM
jgi:hypothetical protein